MQKPLKFKVPLPDAAVPPQENFCGTSIIVPDLEAVLHLREDGKKSWKQRLFQLRASGIYYVPKGKTKVSDPGLTSIREEQLSSNLSCPPQSSRDLVCFVQFDNLNVYYGKDFRSKYKAPTDFCFVLKVRSCHRRFFFSITNIWYQIYFCVRK